MTLYEKSYETDPFCYEGSEAQKADIAAKEAAEEGKWEEFMSESIAKSMDIVRQTQLPDQPPQYRDFDDR